MAVLDSSFLIDILRNKPSAATLLGDLEGKESVLAVAAPSVAEMWEGALLSSIPEREKKRVEDLLLRLTVFPLDEAAAKRTAEIEASLIRQGQQIGWIDVMVAGIALVRGETLVSGDVHFARIPGLRLLKY
ncbi:MAG TPA: PIN domain-containing protein [Candidatus Nanoarchaeia archaeon]|nr:PIN domain-containing protein [Candidatus Nanoarchaeia archaeon]